MTTVGEEKRWNPRIGGDANENDFTGYMDNLGLPHPKQIDVAVPANLVCGRTGVGERRQADVGADRAHLLGRERDRPVWVSEHRGAVTILDVREPVELGGDLGRVEGSIHLPLGELRGRLAGVPRDKPIVCVCRSGRRSAQACTILEKAGVQDVANLAGGMIRWRALGL